MNGNRYYGVRVEGAKYCVGFGSALAVAIASAFDECLRDDLMSTQARREKAMKAANVFLPSS